MPPKKKMTNKQKLNLEAKNKEKAKKAKEAKEESGENKSKKPVFAPNIVTLKKTQEEEKNNRLFFGKLLKVDDIKFYF